MGASGWLSAPGRGTWIGIVRVRWFEALAGVRRSKRRTWESLETEVRREGLWGEKAAE